MTPKEQTEMQCPECGARLVLQHMTPKEAMRMIVQDSSCPALNWAVNYARAGLEMDEDSEEFRVQCLYIQGNISRWKAGSTSQFSSDQIKQARQAIKEGGKKHGIRPNRQ